MARYIRRERCCYGKSSVCQSVRLSVTLGYRDHTGWNSSKIISRLVSLGCSLSAASNITDLLQKEHPEILTVLKVGMKKWLSACKSSNISETGQDMD